MNAIDVYLGSDGQVTRTYYAELGRRGALGAIATCLFRAQKSSARAKKYRGGIKGVGSFRGMAYERKGWAMENLCKALIDYGPHLRIQFGWKKDPGAFNEWVLYVELPQGQVSFHSPTRYDGPDYWSDWDKTHASADRILEFCNSVMRKRPIRVRDENQMELDFSSGCLSLAA